MNIRIICIGKIKSKNLEFLVNEYLKKINTFNKCEIIELKENSYSVENDEKIKKILLEDEKNIEKYMNDSYNISLVIEGKEIDSIELSQKIVELNNYCSKKYVNFIIGSSHGISKNIKENSQMLLSISKMTFPHQLARLILLEQLYRSFCIIKNINYHK